MHYRASLHLLIGFTTLPFLLTACGPNTCGSSLFSRGSDDSSGVVPASTGNSQGSSINVSESSVGGSTTLDLALEEKSSALPLAIEESDLVKLEGDTLFVHNEQRGLNVIDVTSPADPSITATVADVAGKAGELYIHSGHALVLLGEQEDTCTLPETIDSWTITQRHRVTSVDLAAEEAPQLASDLCLPGHIVGSRLIGDTMYVVSTMDRGESSLSWVIGIDVSDPAAASVVSHSVVSGLAHEVHVTENAIYLVQGVDSSGAPVEAEIATHTQLRYFDIKNGDGQITQRGKMELPGAPQGRFHLDEYEDTFRMVTFQDRASGSNLYVVDISQPDTLTLKSQLTGIAPTEDLHATRFVGEKVYIVTYEAVILQTDPLWVISLEDPANPEILGHLEVPGFSSYVFPRGDTLLAVGRGDRGDRVAASLFDVSDPTNPRELTRLEFGNQEAFTEGNLDFRGVTVIENPSDGGSPLLALPTTHQSPLSDGTCKQDNAITFIDVEERSLSLRGSLNLSNRVQRSFDKDDLLLAVGRSFVGTVNYARRDAPAQVGGVWLDDGTAPIECIAFNDIYGNSSDAIENGGEVDWMEGGEVDWMKGGWGDEGFSGNTNPPVDFADDCY